MPLVEQAPAMMRQITRCMGCDKTILVGPPSLPAHVYGKWTCNNQECQDKDALANMDSQVIVASLFSDVNVES